MNVKEISATPTLEISTSRQMLSRLVEQKLSIALTSYQIGKLYFIGLKPDNGLSQYSSAVLTVIWVCARRQMGYL